MKSKSNTLKVLVYLVCILLGNKIQAQTNSIVAKTDAVKTESKTVSIIAKDLKIDKDTIHFIVDKKWESDSPSEEKILPNGTYQKEHFSKFISKYIYLSVINESSIPLLNWVKFSTV